MEAYQELETRFKRLSHLGGAGAILGWDSACMMPPGGADVRGEQSAALAVTCHQMITDPKVGDLIQKAKDDEEHLNDWQQENLFLMERDYLHSTAVPERLVEALSLAGNQCEHVWRTAKKENDFKTYAPLQQKVLELVREIAAVKAEAFNCSLYDALLDQYDAGRTSAEIDKLFTPLRAFLPEFIGKALEAQKKKPAPLPIEGTFPAAAQKALGIKLMSQIGFDFEHGRLDESSHPFCGGVPGDVRITTRYDENDFTSALMGVLHETGHALYENGLPTKWRGQPVGTALGMSIHESQSLFMEMQVCRGLPFLTFAAPLVRDAFGGKGKAWEAENLYAHYARVEPGFIRVDADEVTYPCHILLRYDLEKDLLAGNLEIKDLPERWRADMKKLLGLEPKTDREGCMQDIHWTDGAFGYFPTYTLGAMTAAQLMAAVRKKLPDLDAQIAKGDFKPLLSWLRENVHGQGSRYNAHTLVERATGEPLNPDIYMRHLKARYA